MFRKILGGLFFTISLVTAGILYIASFNLWVEIAGSIGFFIALFAAPDLVLFVIQIVKHGFGSWYPLTFIATMLLFWIGSAMLFKDDNR